MAITRTAPEQMLRELHRQFDHVILRRFDDVYAIHGVMHSSRAPIGSVSAYGHTAADAIRNLARRVAF